jgi:hypothetical protein
MLCNQVRFGRSEMPEDYCALWDRLGRYKIATNSCPTNLDADGRAILSRLPPNLISPLGELNNEYRNDLDYRRACVLVWRRRLVLARARARVMRQ